jgi:ABC-type polysaccharide/polyol phosphate export permease
MLELARDLYRFRELVWALALKELTLRYKRSVLGFLWALLNPAFFMIVLTIVFTTIMPQGIPHFAIFLLSTLVPWTFFSQCSTYVTESIIGNADLLKKVKVPKVVFPVAAVVSNLINLALSIIPLAVLVLLMGHRFYWTWLLLPISTLALGLFSLGFGLLLATANVFYRDVSHIIQILLNLWFYLTPILYKPEMFPPHLRWLFKLNPVVYVLNEYRMMVYYGMVPTVWSFVASFGVGFIALAFGYAVFKRNQAQFVFYV